jgi:hypothetical protein
MLGKNLYFTALVLLTLVTLESQFGRALAQGTAFTYNGRLNDGGGLANGFYDFRFRLYSDSSGNSQVGSAYATNAISVAGGLFTTTIDFGAGIFTGPTYWMVVEVKTNNAANYTALNPLQAITAAPYAIYSATAGNASSISAANIVGIVPLSGLPAGLVTNNQTGATLNGSFNGNGAGLTNLNLTGPTASAAQGNTANGYQALASDTIGTNNTATGVSALYSNTTGTRNVADGYFTLRYNTTGFDNTANGAVVLQFNTTGANNTAVGAGALQFNTTGGNNTAVGKQTFNNSTTGSNNMAFGFQAGYNITTGNSNLDIGNLGVASDNNIIRIGSGQSQAFIAGVITGNGAGLTNLATGGITTNVLVGALTFYITNGVIIKIQ